MQKRYAYIVPFLIGLYIVFNSIISTYQLIFSVRSIPNFGVDATYPLFVISSGLFGVITVIGAIVGFRNIRWGKVIAIIGVILALLTSLLF